MADKEKHSIERVFEINEAIMSINDVVGINATASYRLGKLKRKCESIGKQYLSTQKKKKEEFKKFQESEEYKALTDEEKKSHISVFAEEMDNLFTKETEILNVPELKIADFLNKEGKSLVPQKFYSLMADLIKES